MARLKLNPEPTFKAKAPIPVPGAVPALVEFTFKHKTRSALKEWLATEGLTDVQSVQDIAAGWDLDDEFNAENIGRLCENYTGAARAIVATYIAEIGGTAREKN